jgi:hypothetical protein
MLTVLLHHYRALEDDFRRFMIEAADFVAGLRRQRTGPEPRMIHVLPSWPPPAQISLKLAPIDISTSDCSPAPARPPITES